MDEIEINNVRDLIKVLSKHKIGSKVTMEKLGLYATIDLKLNPARGGASSGSGVAPQRRSDNINWTKPALYIQEYISSKNIEEPVKKMFQRRNRFCLP